MSIRVARLTKTTFAVLAALLLLVSSLPVYAQSAGQGLEISPPLIEKSGDPGSTQSFTIRVRNVTSATLVVTTTVDDFVANGEDGQAKLLLDNKETSPYSVKGWATLPAQITLVKDEAKSVQIDLHVPKDAAPGGHYGVARFTGAPPGVEGSGVSLSASIGTLMLVNVSGQAKTSAKLVEFYTTSNGKKGAFFDKGPYGFTERIQNTGNVHFKPTGTVRVTDWRGHEVQVLSVNTTGGNVLPNSIRKFSQEMDKNKKLFGRYQAELNVQYSGQTLSGSLSFWVIPLKTIAIAAGVIIVAFLMIRSLMRNYTKRAVNKAIGTQKTKTKSSSNKKK
jgi:hypothetical protein